MNDAPALKKANVGIAVAGATPAAKGAADIILTEVRSCSALAKLRTKRAKIFCTHRTDVLLMTMYQTNFMLQLKQLQVFACFW